MKLYLLIISFWLINSSVFSQEKIEVFYESEADGGYKMYAINPNFCTYTVEITFTDLHNLQGSVSFPFRMEVQKGQNYLFSLEKVQENLTTSFNFKTKSYLGCINPKVDESFLYLLPIGEGKKTKPFELDYFKINRDDPEPKNFYALGFSTSLGDTIYAARRGVVSNVKDSANLAYDNYDFATADNFIDIFHEDCSFARYQILENSLVKLGQQVEAGDPIAISGGEKYASGPHFRFEVYYNDDEKNTTKKEESDKIHYWAFIPLHFYTKEGSDHQLEPHHTYTSVHPESIITQEMNKRQKKKWKRKMEGQ